MRDRLKNSYNLLILLGFICQGFAWENFVMPVLFAGVWLVCLSLYREKRLFSKELEPLIFLLAIVFFVKVGGDTIYKKSVAIGNALLTLQAMRMLWPLNKRDKLLGLAIAMTHLSIGSLFMLDYSFIFFLGAIIYLVPKIINQLESSEFQHKEPVSFSSWFGWKEWCATVLIASVIFLVVPRKQLLNPTGASSMSFGRSGVMAPRMNSSSSAEGNNAQVIFQIQGEELDYLKAFALDKFDGDTWTASPFSYKNARRFSRRRIDSCLFRKVTVKKYRQLGLSLPTDGYVEYLNGNYFQDAFVRKQGTVIVSYAWHTNNNFYEYWTLKNEKEALDKKTRGYYLQLPEKNPKLLSFADSVSGNTGDSTKIAESLTKHLHDNFKYKLGVPNLDRFNPIEDFIFNAKEGHCERFASALAVLLRLKKIPSRVAVGYLALDRNQFADFYNVRNKDAHAWTEAYIDGKWKIFDPTPALESAEESQQNLSLSLLDWIEYLWYTKIINYSVSDQNFIFSLSSKSFKFTLMWMKKLLIYIVVLLSLVFAGYIYLRLRGHSFDFWSIFHNGKRLNKQQASHFYGQMLKELSKQRIYRLSSQTPYEFISTLEKHGFEMIDDVRLITQTFCAVKYGESPMDSQLKHRIEEALRKIRTRKTK